MHIILCTMCIRLKLTFPSELELREFLARLLLGGGGRGDCEDWSELEDESWEERRRFELAPVAAWHSFSSSICSIDSHQLGTWTIRSKLRIMQWRYDIMYPVWNWYSTVAHNHSRLMHYFCEHDLGKYYKMMFAEMTDWLYLQETSRDRVWLSSRGRG